MRKVEILHKPTDTTIIQYLSTHQCLIWFNRFRTCPSIDVSQAEPRSVGSAADVRVC